MKTLFILFLIFVVKVYADCWSQPLGYPCCSSSNKNVIYTDKDGDWGIENNGWCGFLKDIPITTTKTLPTTKKNCKTFTFAYYSCSIKGGRPSQVVNNGCPTPVCDFAKCWSEKLGYPCCKNSNTDVAYIDADGKWGVENHEWCGITKETPTPTTKRQCPTFTYPYGECERKGTLSSITNDGCPTPTCVFDQECWSLKYGIECCELYYHGETEIDERGEWGTYGNGKKCGIRPDKTAITTTTTTTTTTTSIIPPTPTKECPVVNFSVNDCIQKNGTVSSITISGCLTPTCVIEQRCLSEFNYPCCSLGYDKIVYSDKYAYWGFENGDWCVMMIVEPTPTETTSTTTTTFTTLRKNCPVFTFPYDDCVKKGYPTKVTRNGCATPTCVIEQECWSLQYGIPCCSYYYHGDIETDERGKWGIRGTEKCGILKDITETPVPTN
ncbi:hypothetical protein BCR32DRAFT_328973 [Anaeromyces robustus]|jgi:hypothetical protein|uniref:CBM10 domain-containing protein n=1 Tax=Anaeromyces robustus TaxID=1754192 RepID=A0A1Y1WV70_9FUNG|nr:hypothetical protein BCR32DRAFT_328973 [Anaeromyces robustus]|eukprot:ORX77305.1 hypothetical protein BCR32DRAFT_328973 [Anaeromyces robustus]